jgi:hypothetical protein
MILDKNRKNIGKEKIILYEPILSLVIDIIKDKLQKLLIFSFILLILLDLDIQKLPRKYSR